MHGSSLLFYSKIASLFVGYKYYSYDPYTITTSQMGFDFSKHKRRMIAQQSQVRDHNNRFCSASRSKFRLTKAPFVSM